MVAHRWVDAFGSDVGISVGCLERTVDKYCRVASFAQSLFEHVQRCIVEFSS